MHQPPKKRRTGLIITVIFAALAMVGGGVTAAILIKGKDGGQTAHKGPEPADVQVIAQKTEPDTIKYGDMAVLDACSVMPATLIEEIGFKAAAHGWHSQAYLPRSVPSADATIKDQIGDSVSSCLYEPMNEKEITRITLSIRQSPFNRLYQVDSPDKDETPLDVAGIKAYVTPDKKPDSFNARIITGDSKVQAHLSASTMADNKEITDYRATFVKLVERVATNIAKGPQGRTTHVHTGRYASLPNACDILSAELFQELTQSRDAGLVEADFREPEIFKKFVDDKSETRYFYSNQQGCRRFSPEWFNVRQRSKGKALKVELRTYRDADMAVKAAQDCNPNSPARAITGEAVLTDEKIGDFAACSYLVGSSPTMSFVAGRTQVQLTADGDWAPDDPKKYNEVFAPIAKRMVDEVREAIG